MRISDWRSDVCSSDLAQQQNYALRNALAALLGKGPDRGLDITRPRLLDAPSPGVPAVLPSELLGHRADVVAARWRVEAASRGIEASKAAFKPRINLNALLGLAPPDRTSVRWGTGVSVRVDLGGRRINEQ